MRNPYLARFDGAPALVAPERQAEFESALAALFSHPDLATISSERAADSSDDFWTELGPRASKAYRPYKVEDGILLVPVRGVLLDGFPYQFFSLATGYEYIGKAVERGLADADVRGIVLVINSPGGAVAGNFDLVDQLYASRSQKPLRAVAAEHAYSAAYSIASAASHLTVARTGGLGSIGVVTAHVDMSKALEDYGVKVTLIHAGKHKVDGNPYAALPDDVKDRIQARIDGIHDLFVETVARNRNLDAAAVRATEALTYTATEAREIGLADAIGHLDGALADFAAELNPDTGDDTMSDQKAAVTVASVKADHPDVANALRAEGRQEEATASQARQDAAVREATDKERARNASLDGFLARFPNNTKAAQIVQAAKAGGTSVEATAVKLLEADVPAQAAALAGLKGDDTTATAAAPAAPGDTTTATTPEGWKAEYAASAALQGEFPSAEAYVAFKKDEARKGGSK